MENLKLIVLMNNLIIVSKIEQVGVDIGEPDCKLIDPYLVTKDNTIEYRRRRGATGKIQLTSLFFIAIMK